jgi:hypothetical protein
VAGENEFRLRLVGADGACAAVRQSIFKVKMLYSPNPVSMINNW